MRTVHSWGQGIGLPVGQRVSYLWLKKRVCKREKWTARFVTSWQHHFAGGLSNKKDESYYCAVKSIFKFALALHTDFCAKNCAQISINLNVCMFDLKSEIVRYSAIVRYSDPAWNYFSMLLLCSRTLDLRKIIAVFSTTTTNIFCSKVRNICAALFKESSYIFFRQRIIAHYNYFLTKLFFVVSAAQILNYICN